MMPLLILAKELDSEVSEADLLADREPVSHAVPKLQSIDGQVSMVLFPDVGTDRQLVVQGSVVRQQGFDAEDLTTQGLDAHPDGRL